MFRFGFTFAAPIVVLTLLALMFCTIGPSAAPATAAGTVAPPAVPAPAVTPASTPAAESAQITVTAEEILQRATEAGENVQSSRITLTQEIGFQGQSVVMKTGGVMQGQDRGYVVMDANGMKFEMLILGGTEGGTEGFMRPVGSQLWEQMEEGVFDNPLAQTQSSDFAVNAVLAGEEAVDGIPSFVVEYDLDLGEMFASDPEMSRFFRPEQSTGTGKQWIGKSDSLTRRIDMDINLVGIAGEIALKIALRLGDFDEPVEIPEPTPYVAKVKLAASDPVFEVAFSPDGTMLAACDDDQTLYLWPVHDPELGARAIDHPTALASGMLGVDFYSLAFSPDSQTIAAGSQGEVYLYDLNDLAGEPMILTPTDGTDGADGEGEFQAVAYSPDGQYLAGGAADGRIFIWSLQEPEEPPLVLTGHEDAIRDLLYLPDGAVLASASMDNTIRLWDMADPEQAPRVLTGHKVPVYDLDMPADGATLLSVGFKDPVYAWSMKSPGNRPDALIKAVDEAIGKYPTLAVAVSPDGKYVATADVFGEVRLWAAPEFDEPYAKFSTMSQYDIMTIAFSPDGRYLAAGQGDASVHLWDLAPETVAPAPPLDENEARARLSAREILTRSSEAMGALQTLNMAMTVDYRPDESAPGEEAGEQRILTQTVTYRFPDEKHMATNYSDVLRIEEVQLPDGTIYGRDAGKGEWHKVTAIFFPALESLRQPETLARSAHLSGTEILDGVETYVVTFDVRPQELLGILNQDMLNRHLGTSRSSATGTVWIGQEDFLPRRVVYEVSHVTPWVDNGARVVVDLGGFDEPVEMPSPVN